MENRTILTRNPDPDSSTVNERSADVGRSLRAAGDSERDASAYDTVVESPALRSARDSARPAPSRPESPAASEPHRYWISILAPLAGSLAIAAVLVFQIRQLNQLARPARGGNVSASYSWVDTISDHGAAGNPGQAFAQTYTVPARFLVANKALRVTAYFDFSTSSAPPKLTLVLQLGKVNISSMTPSAPTAAPPASASIDTTAVTQGSAIWTIQGIEPAGPAVSVYAGSLLNLPGVGAASAMNDVPQPVMGIDTASPATLDIAAVWAPGDTGKSSITLQQFVVEALN